MNVDQEIERLRRKADARRGQPGYAENVREIEARIRELERSR